MRHSSPPMTLGNTRANGVRTLAVWCVGRGCGRDAVIDVERYANNVPVPWFGPRMRCERCGHIGADARPNWSEIAAQGRVGYNRADAADL